MIFNQKLNHSDPFGFTLVLFGFLDMAVRQDKLRQIVGNPTGRQTHSAQGGKHA